MVSYKCRACNKIFKLKGDYNRHLQRKNPCAPNSTDEHQKTPKEKSIMQPQNQNFAPTPAPDCTGKSPKVQETHNCGFCNQLFSRKWVLRRHYDRCEVKRKRDEDRERIYQRLLAEMDDMKAEMKEFKKGPKKIVNNTQNINNNNTQNIQNNIKLVAFGKEDMKKLKHDDVVPLLRGYYTPVHMTEFMHFNPDRPEYHNVYISNIKDKYAMVFNGTEWELMSKERVVDDLYQEKKDHVEENLETFLESLSGPKQRALRRWLDTPDEDVRVKRVKDEIKLLLYNKRNIPLKSRGPHLEIDN